MGLIPKVAAGSFDKALLFLSRTRMVCRHQPSPDHFDNRVLSIDEFHEAYSGFLERPWDFYQASQSNHGLLLRDGVHPCENRVPSVPLRSMLFDSPIVTQWPENNLAPFKWLANGNRFSETLLLLVPGWGRTNQSHEEQLADRLRRSGIDVGLLTKPLHQARTPKGAFSGEYWISANLYWTIANFRQLTAEIRLLVQYMRDYYARIGIIGISSGGFQAALASSCEPVDFFFPTITGGQLGSITWHGLSTEFIRRELEARGIDEQQLNKVWSICDGAVLGRHCKAAYIRQYISLYDQVVPTRFQYSLWTALGQPDKRELPCGHFSSYFFLKKVVDDIAQIVNRSQSR